MLYCVKQLIDEPQVDNRRLATCGRLPQDAHQYSFRLSFESTEANDRILKASVSEASWQSDSGIPMIKRSAPEDCLPADDVVELKMYTIYRLGTLGTSSSFTPQSFQQAFNTNFQL